MKEQLINQIEHLPLEQIQSVQSKTGNIKVRPLANLLGYHRDTLLNHLGTKSEITKLVDSILISKSSSYPNKNTPNTAANPKPEPKPIRAATALRIENKENFYNKLNIMKPKQRSYTSTSESEIYADEIREHKEKFNKKYQSVLATGDMDKLEQVVKKYETFTLPNGNQYQIR